MESQTQASVEDRLRRVIANYFDWDETARDGIRSEQRLSGLNIDSLDAVEITMEIEEEFGVTLLDERLESMTFQQIADLVEKALAPTEQRA